MGGKRRTITCGNPGRWLGPMDTSATVLPPVASCVACSIGRSCSQRLLLTMAGRWNREPASMNSSEPATPTHSASVAECPATCCKMGCQLGFLQPLNCLMSACAERHSAVPAISSSWQTSTSRGIRFRAFHRLMRLPLTPGEQPVSTSLLGCRTPDYRWPDITGASFSFRTSGVRLFFCCPSSTL